MENLGALGSREVHPKICLNDTVIQFSSVNRVRSLQPHGLKHTRPPCPVANSWSLLKLKSIELVMSSNHLILCCPLFLLPAIFPNIRIFSNESVIHIRWPKYWSCSFSISPSNEYSELISFRMAWLDLLAVQGTLKSLLQHHSSKASILRCSAFFMMQLSIHDIWFSHPYIWFLLKSKWDAGVPAKVSRARDLA